MLVVHGLWAYGGLRLWAEDSSLLAGAPARGGRPPRAPRAHPFAVSRQRRVRTAAPADRPGLGR